ncbi:MAG: imidazoleglycerol-phosphate dehydratase, partial [Puniceicoccales bacterium]|nr:imidazoleglycerol-phosphate dehydratase [Puniceicoccales bacterium]
MGTLTRTATLRRETAETQIELTLNLDGTGVSSVATGVPFLDHMLTLFSRHSLVDLTVKAHGDTDVDYHHTVEDVGIVL